MLVIFNSKAFQKEHHNLYDKNLCKEKLNMARLERIATLLMEK